MHSRSLATKCLLLAVLLAAGPAGARTRPHYGGTTVIELREPAYDLDPASWSPEMRAQVLPLLFETLTTLDEHGNARPLLALRWRRIHSTRWTFELRKNARFADGSPVVASGVAEQFSRLVSGLKVQAQTDGTLIMDTPSAWEGLPEMLSLPRFAVFKRYEDGSLVGTGPYTVKQWEPGKTLVLARNSSYWGAAPFLDAVEVRFTANASSVVVPERTGDDLLELTLPQTRNLPADDDIRLGAPTQLYALVWTNTPGAVDERICKALPLVIGRESLAAAFGRDTASAAYSYLPEEVSGYAFLFRTQPEPAAARALVTDSRRRTPVALAYRADDPVARLVAERVAVNARDAGLNVQPFGDRDPRATLTTSAQAAIVRIPILGGSPAVALYDVASVLQLDANPVLAAPNAERLLQAERDLLSDTRALPIVFVPSALWISPRLHDVANAPQWRLDSAWIAGGQR